MMLQYLHGREISPPAPAYLGDISPGAQKSLMQWSTANYDSWHGRPGNSSGLAEMAPRSPDIDWRLDWSRGL